MTKKRLAKKKKIVDSDLADDSSTEDWMITPHGSIAGVRPQSGGIYTDGHIIQSISPPGTGHQSQSTSHRSFSLVTSHSSSRHPSMSIDYQAPVNQALGTNHQAPVTTHPALVIRQQMLGTEYRVANYIDTC